MSVQRTTRLMAQPPAARPARVSRVRCSWLVAVLTAALGGLHPTLAGAKVERAVPDGDEPAVVVTVSEPIVPPSRSHEHAPQDRTPTSPRSLAWQAGPAPQPERASRSTPAQDDHASDRDLGGSLPDMAVVSIRPANPARVELTRDVTALQNTPAALVAGFPDRAHAPPAAA